MKYKARLVVKGFLHKKGVNFDEIFSLVVNMASIRIILGLVISLNLEFEQLDVKTTFFHGNLHEEIYMEQLEGFEVSGKENLVCKLKKSLYDLKASTKVDMLTKIATQKKLELCRDIAGIDGM